MALTAEETSIFRIWKELSKNYKVSLFDLTYDIVNNNKNNITAKYIFKEPIKVQKNKNITARHFRKLESIFIKNKILGNSKIKKVTIHLMKSENGSTYIDSITITVLKKVPKNIISKNIKRAIKWAISHISLILAIQFLIGSFFQLYAYLKEPILSNLFTYTILFFCFICWALIEATKSYEEKLFKLEKKNEEFVKWMKAQEEINKDLIDLLCVKGPDQKEKESLN